MIANRGKFLLCYEVDPALKSQFPNQPDKHDSNNGISTHFSRVNLNMCVLNKYGVYSSSYKLDKLLPRQMWVNLNWTLQELHLNVFKYLR